MRLPITKTRGEWQAAVEARRDATLRDQIDNLYNQVVAAIEAGDESVILVLDPAARTAPWGALVMRVNDLLAEFDFGIYRSVQNNVYVIGPKHVPTNDERPQP